LQSRRLRDISYLPQMPCLTGRERVPFHRWQKKSETHIFCIVGIMDKSCNPVLAHPFVDNKTQYLCSTGVPLEVTPQTLGFGITHVGSQPVTRAITLCNPSPMEEVTWTLCPLLDDESAAEGLELEAATGVLPPQKTRTIQVRRQNNNM
jgi:hypothetical protein